MSAPHWLLFPSRLIPPFSLPVFFSLPFRRPPSARLRGIMAPLKRLVLHFLSLHLLRATFLSELSEMTSVQSSVRPVDGWRETVRDGKQRDWFAPLSVRFYSSWHAVPLGLHPSIAPSLAVPLFPFWTHNERIIPSAANQCLPPTQYQQ